MNFDVFFQWAFFSVITGSAIVITWHIRDIAQSVDRLNIEIAKVVKSVEFQERILTDHSSRLTYLEQTKHTEG